MSNDISPSDRDPPTFVVSHRYPAFGDHIAHELTRRYGSPVSTVTCEFKLSGAEDAIQRVARHQADVLILDTEPGRMERATSGITPAMFVEWLRNRHTRTRVVALSDSDSSAFIASLLRASASAHVYMPSAHTDDVLTAVDTALLEAIYLCAHSKQVMNRALDSVISLTPREMEIARALARQPGSTFEQIAPQLFMSSGTLRAHLNNLRVKLGLSSSDEIAPTVRRFGLIE